MPNHLQVTEPFLSLVRRIELAYAGLGHRLGWRFLYSPARTLSPETRLAFVGTDPGGSSYVPPSTSVEAGDAYRLESWPGAGASGLNPLQEQIVLLYDALASALRQSSRARLMDDTLAANFCPFRSPSWERLARREESIRFSRDLWKAILDFVTPSAVICLGDASARQLGATLATMGWSLKNRERGLVGWGSVSYELAVYEGSGTQMLLARLPHLSRFRILGRAQSQPAIERVVSSIAAAMSGDGDPHLSHALREPPLQARKRASRRTPTGARPSGERALMPVPRPAVKEDRRSSPVRLGASATSLLAKQSYSISDHRADQFLLMLDHIAGLRAELDARDLAALRQMVSPGGYVHPDLSRRFAKPIASYAGAIGYNQVNWLRGAIAVYVAEKESRRSRAAD
jgi:hypothetical protein